MTRLCGLNPMIDYTPVKWAVRENTVRSTNVAETTVTAYEALMDEDRAILLLLNGNAHYWLGAVAWTIEIDFHGSRYRLVWQDGCGWTLREFIGYLLDHGHPPDLNDMPVPKPPPRRDP